MSPGDGIDADSALHVATRCSASGCCGCGSKPRVRPGADISAGGRAAPVEAAPLIGFDLDGASVWVCPGADAGMVTAIIRALKASK